MLKLGMILCMAPWNFFASMWIKVLREWEDFAAYTLPQKEVTLMITALASMQQSTVRQHPRVVLSQSRTPPPQASLE